jgi:hypothetical protein
MTIPMVRPLSRECVIVKSVGHWAIRGEERDGC